MQELSLVAIVICVMIGFFTLVLCGFGGGIFLYLRSASTQSCSNKSHHRSNNQRTESKTESKTDQRFVSRNIVNMSPMTIPQTMPNVLAESVSPKPKTHKSVSAKPVSPKSVSPKPEDKPVDMFSQIFKVLNMLEIVSKIYSGFAAIAQPNPQEVIPTKVIPQGKPVVCDTMTGEIVSKYEPKQVESKLPEQKLSNKDNINEARQQVKEMFVKKEDELMTKMIDSISDKIISTDSPLKPENMFSIAQNVASEMKRDFGNNPEMLQSMLQKFLPLLQVNPDNKIESAEPKSTEMKRDFGNNPDMLQSMVQKFLKVNPDNKIESTEPKSTEMKSDFGNNPEMLQSMLQKFLQVNPDNKIESTEPKSTYSMSTKSKPKSIRHKSSKPKSSKPKSRKFKEKPVDAQTMAITNLTLQMSKVMETLNSVSQVNANLVTTIQQPNSVGCCVVEPKNQNIIDEPKNIINEPVIQESKNIINEPVIQESKNIINEPVIQESKEVSDPTLEIYNIEDVIDVNDDVKID